MLIEVAIFEDNDSLRNLLESQIRNSEGFGLVGGFPAFQDVLPRLKQHIPHVVLMDIDMPGMDGITATKIIRREFPNTQVLMLTVFDNDEHIFDAICAGACGYLLKHSSISTILDSIRMVYEGGAPMSPSIARRVVSLLSGQPKRNEAFEALSPREQEVLRCLSTGNSYKMAAADLGISIETIRTHIKRIYEKLHVHCLAEAMNKTYLQG